jgi:glycosyltransferase involved in cell wall biosynthesis
MLVPPADPKALAEAMEALLAAPVHRKQMGQAASIYAREHFGLPGHSEQIRKVIDELVAH